MDIKEFEERKAELEKQATQKMLDLYRECAYSNNTVQVGDIVTDHMGSIKVESIRAGWGFGMSLPVCVYKGQTLKKDGTPTKREEKRDVYQNNIV